MPTVYLLHLIPPYRHAKHYTGWTARPLEERLSEHRGFQGRDLGGKGSSLLAAQNRVGGSWVVARTWAVKTNHDARDRERKIKHKAAARFCPICKAGQGGESQG